MIQQYFIGWLRWAARDIGGNLDRLNCRKVVEYERDNKSYFKPCGLRMIKTPFN